MPRLILLARTIWVPEERHHLLDEEWLRELLRGGKFTNDEPARLDGGYGARPEEVAPFMEGHGLETLALLAAESISRGLEAAIAETAEQAPEVHARMLDVLAEVAEEPSILAMSGHLLLIGRRSG